MADEFSVIEPTQAMKIIAFQKNADGTLSPTPLVRASLNPVILPTEAAPVQFFKQNADGTLSPTII